MKVKITYEDRIRLGNGITKNLLEILDNKNISKDKKIDDYIVFLSNRTSIKESKIKKYLKYDILKYITIDDIDEMARALEVDAIDILKNVD